MRITIVAGARPNFMKIAPIIHEMERLKAKAERLKYRLVHTGQHYDPKLSDTFFKELGIPKPDVNLEVGSGTQAEQTAGIMPGFEKELTVHPSDRDFRSLSVMPAVMPGRTFNKSSLNIHCRIPCHLPEGDSLR